MIEFCYSCKVNMISVSFLLLSLLTFTTAKPTVYLIRHGEKPVDGDGLNTQGVRRAQCLVNVFKSKSHYKIGHIMAQTPQVNGKQQRPYDTVVPLARSLNLTVDTSCQRDDSTCVAKMVHNYTGPRNILICWEHKLLTKITAALGDATAPTYPDTSWVTLHRNKGWRH